MLFNVSRQFISRYLFHHLGIHPSISLKKAKNNAFSAPQRPHKGFGGHQLRIQPDPLRVGQGTLHTVKVRTKLPAFQLLAVPAGLERLPYPLTTTLVDNQENYFPHYLTAVGIDLLFLEEYLRLAPRLFLTISQKVKIGGE